VKDSTEQHFQMLIYLMLVFFFVAVGLDTLHALKILDAASALDMAKESYKACFYIAIGMFHGMLPEGSPLQAKTNVTSDLQIHTEALPVTDKKDESKS
jgi:hypothetical protein